MFQTMLTNWWTTLVGFVTGVAYYLANSGAVMPRTKQEWINFVVGALLAGFGLVAKSATVGSKPGA